MDDNFRAKTKRRYSQNPARPASDPTPGSVARIERPNANQTSITIRSLLLLLLLLLLLVGWWAGGLLLGCCWAAAGGR